VSETVLVTGGTGFVASWCIAELLARGYRVRATVRGLYREPAVRAAAAVDGDPGDRLTCVVADLTSDDGWPAAMAGVDYVLHVAQPTTILPGAVFGPIRSTSTVGSVGIVARMLRGQMRGAPKIGLEIVDVRDLADVHLRAMTSPAAAGQRFLATGEFMWMKDVGQVLHDRLGVDGKNAPTRELPNIVVRFAARLLDPTLRAVTPSLGRRARHSTDKARQVLDWTPRPAADAVLECARSLIEWKVV
jgi:nucleoside-diphosphate-sugar epimerase